MFGAASAAISASRKNPAPKCGMMTGTLGKARGRSRQRERVAAAKIEHAGQAEPHARLDRQIAAVGEDCAAMCGRHLEELGHPVVVERVAVQRGEEARAAHAESRKCVLALARSASGATGLMTKKPTKRSG